MVGHRLEGGGGDGDLDHGLTATFRYFVGHPLRLGDLSGRHFGGEFIAVFGCYVTDFNHCCARGRQVEPHVGGQGEISATDDPAGKNHPDNPVNPTRLPWSPSEPPAR